MTKIPQTRGSDDIYTPPEAVRLLFPYIKKEWLIWECAVGTGNILRALDEGKFSYFGTDIKQGFDFLKWVPEISYGCIITNPPFSIKDKFLRRCYALKKPFALIMPLTGLEGKVRQALYKEHGVQLIVPNKRIKFDTGTGKKQPWFASAWYTWGLNLPKDLNFVEM